MKNKVIKILFALFGLGLLGILIFFYTAFNGSPIKVWLTRVQVQRYLHSTYPEVKFTNVTGLYNFKTGSYGGRALAHIEPTVSIYIDQRRKGQFSDNLIQAKLDAQAKAEFKALAERLFPGKEIVAMLYKDADDKQFFLNTNFSKDLPVELFCDVRWSGPVVAKEEFIDEVLAIHNGITAEGYTISSYYFSYSFPPEPESFNLSLKGGELNMDRDKLLNEIYHFKK